MKDSNNMTKIKSDRFEEIQINGNLYRVGEKIGDEHIYNLFTAKSKKPSNYVIKINIGKTRKERFENEILTLSSIKTNSIIKIVKDGNIVYSNTNHNDRYRYYVTKKYDCDFREVMNEKMTINQKLQLFLQMCRSVKYIHKRNIIHRDIKPENFLYDRKRKKVILCDFGISKDFKKNNNLTLSSEKIANSNYCSPEQRKKGNKNFGYYTDIYALGIILNELITNESGYGINYKRVFDVDPSFGELDNVIDRMIAYNFKERENNINNVIYSINKIIKNKSKEIAIHKRNKRH